jgi:hypothetical protein
VDLCWNFLFVGFESFIYQAEPSRTLGFQAWLVYKDAYSGRAIKCVFRLDSFKIRASSSSNSNSLKMLFELSRTQLKLELSY